LFLTAGTILVFDIKIKGPGIIGDGYPALMAISVAKIYFLPILYIVVPHVGHSPFVAGLPFFIVTDLGFFISLLARHFIQYACIDIPPFYYIYHRNKYER